MVLGEPSGRDCGLVKDSQLEGGLMCNGSGQHPNAPLTPAGRRRMVACVLVAGWTVTELRPLMWCMAGEMPLNR